MLVNTNMNVLWSHSSRLEFFLFFFPSSFLLSLCSQVEQWARFSWTPSFLAKFVFLGFSHRTCWWSWKLSLAVFKNWLVLSFLAMSPHGGHQACRCKHCFLVSVWSVILLLCMSPVESWTTAEKKLLCFSLPKDHKLLSLVHLPASLKPVTFFAHLSGCCFIFF